MLTSSRQPYSTAVVFHINLARTANLSKEKQRPIITLGKALNVSSSAVEKPSNVMMKLVPMRTAQGKED